MKVWIDLFSGDEMVSDSYKHQLIFNDACLEVKAKFVTKGSDHVQIAGKLSFSSLAVLTNLRKNHEGKCLPNFVFSR